MSRTWFDTWVIRRSLKFRRGLVVARKLERLSARRVATEKRPGLYPDGGNLYLQVGHGGNKSWIFRYTLNGRARYHGLGAVHTVNLAEAREKARGARKLLEER